MDESLPVCFWQSINGGKYFSMLQWTSLQTREGHFHFGFKRVIDHKRCWCTNLRACVWGRVCVCVCVCVCVRERARVCWRRREEQHHLPWNEKKNSLEMCISVFERLAANLFWCQIRNLEEAFLEKKKRCFLFGPFSYFVCCNEELWSMF